MAVFCRSMVEMLRHADTRRARFTPSEFAVALLRIEPWRGAAMIGVMGIVLVLISVALGG